MGNRQDGMSRRHDLSRHRDVYERHERGETYKEIALSLGISENRTAQLAERWKQELILLEASGDR